MLVARFVAANETSIHIKVLGNRSGVSGVVYLLFCGHDNVAVDVFDGTHSFFLGPSLNIFCDFLSSLAGLSDRAIVEALKTGVE